MMKKTGSLWCAMIFSAALLTGCGKDEEKAGAAPAENSPAVPAVQARNQARQVNYETELKQIGTGIAMYILDHNDNMPATLADIAPYCAGMDFSPFVYIGNIGRMPGNAASVPVVFVKPEFCTGDRLPVMMADGHVTTVTIPGLSGKSMRQITEILVRDIADQTLKNKLLSNAR